MGLLIRGEYGGKTNAIQKKETHPRAALAVEHLVERATSRELPVSANSLKCSESTGIRSQTRYILLRASFRPSVSLPRECLRPTLLVCTTSWDGTVQSAWDKWKNELPAHSQRFLPRCYHPTSVHASSSELHGFCNASELAYKGVVYLRH